MRLIKIPNCSPQLHLKLKNVILENIPFALINSEYNTDSNTAFFNFWDSDYIPETLKQFIVQAPLSREDKDKTDKELTQAIKDCTHKMVGIPIFPV